MQFFKKPASTQDTHLRALSIHNSQDSEEFAYEWKTWNRHLKAMVIHAPYSGKIKKSNTGDNEQPRNEEPDPRLIPITSNYSTYTVRAHQRLKRNFQEILEGTDIQENCKIILVYKPPLQSQNEPGTSHPQRTHQY